MPKVLPEYKEEAKKRIICAALEVMGEKGYSNTTMEDIAAHMGVSKGAIYLYFKSRDELLTAFVRKMQEHTYESARHIFPGKNPLDAWTALFDQTIEMDDRFNSLFFEIIVIAVRNKGAMETFSSGIFKGIECATKGIASQKKKGLINPNAGPRSIAVAITSMFIGMRSLVILGADRNEIKSQWREIGRILLGVSDENQT